MSSEHVRWNYYIPGLRCINYDELENHKEPIPEMHSLWIQLLWVLAMNCSCGSPINELAPLYCSNHEVHVLEEEE